MQIEEIEELIRLIERSQIEEFELERKGTRIRIRKPSGGAAAPGPADPPPAARDETPPAGDAAVPGTVETGPAGAAGETAEQLHVFSAPIVGTFYLTPKPDAESLVEVGGTIEPGQVICIIEAMKIFNQIESDVEGELVRILVENGQPVEFGEALFEIRTSSR